MATRPAGVEPPMRAFLPGRWCIAVLATLLAAPSLAAADATYLQLPGLTGPSTAPAHAGWFEVSTENVVLAPGTLDATQNVVHSQCTATIQTQLGSAGAVVAQLVGTQLGNLKLERVGGPGKSPLFRGVLRNAVLTQASTTFAAGGAFDTLIVRFEGFDVTTLQRRPDGSPGSGTQGTFNCLAPP